MDTQNLHRRLSVIPMGDDSISLHLGSSNDNKETKQPTKTKRRRRFTKTNVLLSSQRTRRLFLFLFCIFLLYNCFSFINLKEGDVETEISKLLWNLPDDSLEKEWADTKIIHIVNTRFMQEQGTLKTLGMARYNQFITFCLATMIHQSSQDFLWIIKTDPSLSKDVLNLMIQAIQESSQSNFYLVESNNNYLINKKNGSWRGGEEGLDLLQSKIHTGNITRLHQAIALRKERPILETRLDADDGLHPYYIQYLQNMAQEKFLEYEEHPADWMYWCIRRHLEWHPSKGITSLSESTTNKSSSHPGILMAIEHKKVCITPGMTVGFNLGVQLDQIPIYPHDVIYQKLSQKRNSTVFHDCYPHGLPIESSRDDESNSASTKLPCLDMAEDFVLGAIRSRSWTSAGMMRIGAGEKEMPQTLTEKAWKFTNEILGIQTIQIQATLNFLEENRKQIAEENLMGQCTTGHSCKDKAKQSLEKIIKHETNK